MGRYFGVRTPEYGIHKNESGAGSLAAWQRTEQTPVPLNPPVTPLKSDLS